MAERVRLLGGALTIRSAPEQGTTVEALLPDTPENTKGSARDDGKAEP
jgi:signal transduction histidine kinase